MLTKNIKELQGEVAAHVAHGTVAHCWHKTGFTDCLAQGIKVPGFLESEFGLPLAVIALGESIFGNLDVDEAVNFVAQFPKEVACDGKDLSRVVWQFLAAELRSLPPVSPEVQAVIDPVITGMNRLAAGQEWSNEDAIAAARAARAARAAESAARAARAAAWAAESAARAARAARAAAWAAESAASAATSAGEAAIADASAATSAGEAAIADAWADARAARAAWAAVRRRQRDLLLRLIKEAPINTQEEN